MDITCTLSSMCYNSFWSCCFTISFSTFLKVCHEPSLQPHIFLFTPWVSDINIALLEIYTNCVWQSLYVRFPTKSAQRLLVLISFCTTDSLSNHKAYIFFSSVFILIFFFRRRVATSFEGKYGRIRYWLKAEVDKPWGFNSKTKRAFTVIDHIDINTSSLLVRDKWAK